MKYISFGFICLVLNVSNAQINFGKFGDLFKSKGSNFELKKRVFLFASSGNNNINGGVELRLNKQSSKWQFFTGVRAMGLKSISNEYYITAPTKYRTNKSEWQNGFSKPLQSNLDTVINVNKNTICSNAYFKVSRRLIQILGAQISTDIGVDLVGLNFIGNKNATLCSNGVAYNTSTSLPKSNLRLLGTNDIGNLNAEFTIRVGFDKLSIYLGWAIVKREIVTTTPQILPNGNNTNFRNTSNGQVFGIRYRI